MSLLTIMLVSAALLMVAYRIYGGLLSRFLRLDDSKVTPAVSMRDGLDYEPIEPKFLLSQHFSAIAAAGPIVGPILAGVMFGWMPALIWILIGSIFIGGVHDMAALIASVRHKARSIAEVVREHMSRRSYILFLLFVWIALLYIIVAFTDIVAGTFVEQFTADLGPGDSHLIPAGSIATSSLLYLALPVVMGLLLRYAKLTVGWATVIFLPLVAVSVWVGQYIPLDFVHIFHTDQDTAHRIWDVLLLVYCFAASLVPVWLLLQPRGHLGGYFLIVAVVGGMLGAIFGNHQIEYPSFIKSTSQPLFPMLFITIACGACSGFHCIIASGTTSKQLRRESDAKPVAYGSMLMEAMVAVLSLACVMILPVAAAKSQSANPDNLYAEGLSTFLAVIGIPKAFGLLFGLLAFTTFVYDTLDVSTRLGRYILQELTGLKNAFGRWLATGITAGVPIIFVLQVIRDPAGNVKPAWSVFWPLFGASNQLLAALALIGITVWLWRTYRARWVWPVAGIPAVFMYVMSAWSLIRFVSAGFTGRTVQGFDPIPWVALVLLLLAFALLVEAVFVLAIKRAPTSGQSPEPVMAT
ncbi:MAG TPA: carbon starvation CstA family protein [Phycisphaerales bacterium]|nr:carbon starvation CstA family protein [Phycisphaerales bacterium]